MFNTLQIVMIACKYSGVVNNIVTRLKVIWPTSEFEENTETKFIFSTFYPLLLYNNAR